MFFDIALLLQVAVVDTTVAVRVEERRPGVGGQVLERIESELRREIRLSSPWSLRADSRTLLSVTSLVDLDERLDLARARVRRQAWKPTVEVLFALTATVERDEVNGGFGVVLVLTNAELQRELGRGRIERLALGEERPLCRVVKTILADLHRRGAGGAACPDPPFVSRSEPLVQVTSATGAAASQGTIARESSVPVAVDENSVVIRADTGTVFFLGDEGESLWSDSLIGIAGMPFEVTVVREDGRRYGRIVMPDANKPEILLSEGTMRDVWREISDVRIETGRAEMRRAFAVGGKTWAQIGARLVRPAQGAAEVTLPPQCEADAVLVLHDVVTLRDGAKVGSENVCRVSASVGLVERFERVDVRGPFISSSGTPEAIAFVPSQHGAVVLRPDGNIAVVAFERREGFVPSVLMGNSAVAVVQDTVSGDIAAYGAYRGTMLWHRGFSAWTQIVDLFVDRLLLRQGSTMLMLDVVTGLELWRSSGDGGSIARSARSACIVDQGMVRLHEVEQGGVLNEWFGGSGQSADCAVLPDSSVMAFSGDALLRFTRWSEAPIVLTTVDTSSSLSLVPQRDGGVLLWEGERWTMLPTRYPREYCLWSLAGEQKGAGSCSRGDSVLSIGKTAFGALRLEPNHNSSWPTLTVPLTSVSFFDEGRPWRLEGGPWVRGSDVWQEVDPSRPLVYVRSFPEWVWKGDGFGSISDTANRRLAPIVDSERVMVTVRSAGLPYDIFLNRFFLGRTPLSSGRFLKGDSVLVTASRHGREDWSQRFILSDSMTRVVVSSPFRRRLFSVGIGVRGALTLPAGVAEGRYISWEYGSSVSAAFLVESPVPGPVRAYLSGVGSAGAGNLEVGLLWMSSARKVRVSLGRRRFFAADRSRSACFPTTLDGFCFLADSIRIDVLEARWASFPRGSPWLWSLEGRFRFSELTEAWGSISRWPVRHFVVQEVSEATIPYGESFAFVGPRFFSTEPAHWTAGFGGALRVTSHSPGAAETWVTLEMGLANLGLRPRQRSPVMSLGVEVRYLDTVTDELAHRISRRVSRAMRSSVTDK